MGKRALLVALGSIYANSKDKYEVLYFPEGNILHFGNLLQPLDWQIEILLNDQATSSNILKSINDISRNNEEGEMLLYLSGHTDKFKTTHETDFMDECFISYDNFLSGEVSNFLIDNLLTSAINEATEVHKCQGFTCIFETCYSAGLIDFDSLLNPEKVAVFASSSENLKTFFTRGSNGNSYFNRALRKVLVNIHDLTYQDLGVRLESLIRILGGQNHVFHPHVRIGNSLLNHKLSS